jgi:hypothetical protein
VTLSRGRWPQVPLLGGTATRLEARAGDTVGVFWNRSGRALAFTLNGAPARTRPQ